MYCFHFHSSKSPVTFFYTSAMAMSFYLLNLSSPPPFLSLKTPPSSLSSPPPSSKNTIRTRALRGWQEYEEAVKEKDLARALRFLKSIETTLPLQPPSPSSIPPSVSPPDGDLRFLLRPERDWEVLDACLNADDMKLVASAYAFLQDRGFLPNFGKCKNIGNLRLSFPFGCLDFLFSLVEISGLDVNLMFLGDYYVFC